MQYIGSIGKRAMNRSVLTLSEVRHLVKKQPHLYPKIVEIWNKPTSEKGDLAEIYRLAPDTIKFGARCYKIHLMPTQNQLTPLIKYLMEEIPTMDEKARKALAGIKLLTWDHHLKIQQESNAKREPTPPTIVVCLVATTPQEAQDTLKTDFLPS